MRMCSNEALVASVVGSKLPKAMKTGTTICGVVFDVSWRSPFIAYFRRRLPSNLHSCEHGHVNVARKSILVALFHASHPVAAARRCLGSGYAGHRRDNRKSRSRNVPLRDAAIHVLLVLRRK